MFAESLQKLPVVSNAPLGILVAGVSVTEVDTVYDRLLDELSTNGLSVRKRDESVAFAGFSEIVMNETLDTQSAQVVGPGGGRLQQGARFDRMLHRDERVGCPTAAACKNGVKGALRNRVVVF